MTFSPSADYGRFVHLASSRQKRPHLFFAQHRSRQATHLSPRRGEFFTATIDNFLLIELETVRDEETVAKKSKKSRSRQLIFKKTGLTLQKETDFPA